MNYLIFILKVLLILLLFSHMDKKILEEIFKNFRMIRVDGKLFIEKKWNK